MTRIIELDKELEKELEGGVAARKAAGDIADNKYKLQAEFIRRQAQAIREQEEGLLKPTPPPPLTKSASTQTLAPPPPANSVSTQTTPPPPVQRAYAEAVAQTQTPVKKGKPSADR